MKKTLPLRTRLTVVYSALLFLAMAVLGIGCMTLLRYRLTARMDAALDHRLKGVENFLIRETTISTEHLIPLELAEYASTQPEGHYIEVTGASGERLLKSDAVLHPARNRETTFTIYGKTYHAKASASAEPIADSVQEIGLLFLGLSPVLLILIGFSGYWLSKRSLEPVDEMMRAARSISAANLSGRLAVPQTRDEISRLAQAWNEMLARLEESFSRIQRFTADAAHEFRTPLAALRTTADLSLKQERDPQEYREALTQVRTIADRMNQLAEGLLAVARGDDSPTRNSDVELVDFSSIVREVTNEMEPLFEDRDLRLSVNVPSDHVAIKADSDGLRRIVAVLLDNALKYSLPEGVVTLLVGQDVDNVTLEVTDTGRGIPPGSVSRIFDRFYRVDASRDRKSGGYGLGLAIAQQIAKAHGGQITASSVLGKGSTFKLTLPKISQSQASRLRESTVST